MAPKNVRILNDTAPHNIVLRCSNFEGVPFFRTFLKIKKRKKCQLKIIILLMLCAFPCKSVGAPDDCFIHLGGILKIFFYV